MSSFYSFCSFSIIFCCFLSIVSGNGISICNQFRHCVIDTMLNRHCACVISRDVYPYVVFQFLTSTLPNRYATFMGLRVFYPWPLMLKAKGVKVQTFAKYWPFRGPGDQGVWKLAIFTAKGTSMRKHWTHVVWAILREGPLRVWPPEPRGKKLESHARLPYHRNDVSPLTQGWRYHSACDNGFNQEYNEAKT